MPCLHAVCDLAVLKTFLKSWLPSTHWCPSLLQFSRLTSNNYFPGYRTLYHLIIYWLPWKQQTLSSPLTQKELDPTHSGFHRNINNDGWRKQKLPGQNKDKFTGWWKSSLWTTGRLMFIPNSMDKLLDILTCKIYCMCVCQVPSLLLVWSRYLKSRFTNLKGLMII